MHFSVDVFGGEVPKVASHLLQDNQSSLAQNCRLGSGEVSTWQEDRLIVEFENLGVAQSIIYYDNAWHFFNEEISVAKAPIVGDRYDRIAITGMDKPRITDTQLVTKDTFNTFILGIPSPVSKPKVTLTGDSGTPVTDTYWVYTYVREWPDGKVDEGPPSPVSDMLELTPTNTVELTEMKVPPDYIEYGVNKIYIYRTQTGSETADFQFVGSVEITDGSDKSFTDDVAGDALGEVLMSSGWSAPPDELEGIINVGNGVLAGFVGNTIYLSDTFQAHAWPSSNAFPMEYDVVGLGAYNNMLIVLTTGFPYTIFIQSPSQVQVIPHRELLPCRSKRSIVNTRDGVIYSGHTGLVLINQNGPSVITNSLFDERDWTTLNPSSILGLYHDNKYFFFWWRYVDVPDSSGELVKKKIQGGFIFDMEDPNAGLSTLNIPTDAVYRNLVDSEIYYTVNTPETTQIYKWEGLTIRHKNYSWKSKEFISLTGEINMSAARVLGRFVGRVYEPNTGKEIENVFKKLLDQGLYGGFNEASWNTYSWNGDRLSLITQFYKDIPRLSFTLYVDGVRVFTRDVENDRVFRLPTKYKGRRFQIELSGNIEVQQVQIATSAMEIV